jgi:hypothetical protein
MARLLTSNYAKWIVKNGIIVGGVYGSTFIFTEAGEIAFMAIIPYLIATYFSARLAGEVMPDEQATMVGFGVVILGVGSGAILSGNAIAIALSAGASSVFSDLINNFLNLYTAALKDDPDSKLSKLSKSKYMRWIVNYGIIVAGVFAGTFYFPDSANIALLMITTVSIANVVSYKMAGEEMPFDSMPWWFRMGIIVGGVIASTFLFSDALALALTAGIFCWIADLAGKILERRVILKPEDRER